MLNEINLHLLSATAHDEFVNGQNQIVLTFYGRDQLHRIFRVKFYHFKHYYFIPTEENSSWKSLDNKKVKKIEIRNLKELRQLQNQNGHCYEIDVHPLDRFLMDQKIFGAIKVRYQDENRQNEIFEISTDEWAV